MYSIIIIIIHVVHYKIRISVCSARTQEQYKKQNEIEKKQHNIKLCTFLLRPTAAVVFDVLVLSCICVCESAAALSTVRKTGNVARYIGGGRTQCRDENVHNYVYGHRVHTQTHTHTPADPDFLVVHIRIILYK